MARRKFSSFPAFFLTDIFAVRSRHRNRTEVGIGLAFLLGFRRGGDKAGTFRAGNDIARAGVGKIRIVDAGFGVLFFRRQLPVFFIQIKSLPVSEIAFPETGKTLLPLRAAVPDQYYFRNTKFMQFGTDYNNRSKAWSQRRTTFAGRKQEPVIRKRRCVHFFHLLLIDYARMFSEDKRNAP